MPTKGGDGTALDLISFFFSFFFFSISPDGERLRSGANRSLGMPPRCPSFFFFLQPSTVWSAHVYAATVVGASGALIFFFYFFNAYAKPGAPVARRAREHRAGEALLLPWPVFFSLPLCFSFPLATPETRTAGPFSSGTRRQPPVTTQWELLFFSFFPLPPLHSSGHLSMASTALRLWVVFDAFSVAVDQHHLLVLVPFLLVAHGGRFASDVDWRVMTLLVFSSPLPGVAARLLSRRSGRVRERRTPFFLLPPLAEGETPGFRRAASWSSRAPFQVLADSRPCGRRTAGEVDDTTRSMFPSLFLLGCCHPGRRGFLRASQPARAVRADQGHHQQPFSFFFFSCSMDGGILCACAARLNSEQTTTRRTFSSFFLFFLFLPAGGPHAAVAETTAFLPSDVHEVGGDGSSLPATSQATLLPPLEAHDRPAQTGPVPRPLLGPRMHASLSGPSDRLRWSNDSLGHQVVFFL